MIKGSVDRIDGHRIKGWCFDSDKPKEPLLVELFIDGEKNAEQIADLFRTDLKKGNNVPDNCAFNILLPTTIEYKGQKIEVKTNNQVLKSRFNYLFGEKNTEKIKRIQIYGERASGTNYLKQLLIKNIPNTAHTNQYGWKHFFPPESFPNSEDCLFIVIYRNPFDWLRSLHLQPHHTHSSLQKIPFSEFIRTEWHCVWDELANVLPDDEKYGTEMLFERNPKTGDRFENVINLRNAKIKAFEELKQKIKNIEFVKYEDLKKNPQLLINRIRKKYNVHSLGKLQTVDTYKGITTKPYIPKIYGPISENDLLFIKKNLDISLENTIGYNAKYRSHNQTKIKPSNIVSKIKDLAISNFKNIIRRKKKPKLSISKQTTKEKIFIHVGMPKTGSSALQAFLLLNAQNLKKLSFHYPVNHTFSQAFQTSSGNAYKLGKMFAEQNTDEINGFLHNNISNNYITVLSSETLYHSLKTNTSFFFKSLEQYDYKIICYVRRQDNAYQSLINQRVKNHNLVLNDKILEELNSYDFYDALFKALEYTQKERFIIRPYEKGQFVGGTIYSDFLNCLDIKWADNFDIPAQYVNPSLNHEALFFRSFLNQIGIDRGKWKEKVLWNEILQKYSVSESFGKPFLEHPLFNAEQRKQIINKHSDINAKIAKIFLNKEDGILFTETLPENDNKDLSINYPKKDSYNTLLKYIHDNNKSFFSKLAEFLFYLNCIKNEKTDDSLYFEKTIKENFNVLEGHCPEKTNHKSITIRNDNYSGYISNFHEIENTNIKNNCISFNSIKNKLKIDIDLLFETNTSNKKNIKAYLIDMSFSFSKQTVVGLMYQTTQNPIFTKTPSYSYHIKKGENNIRLVVQATNLNGKLRIEIGNTPIIVDIKHINIHWFEYL